MSNNTQSNYDNADLLEAYFQAVLTEGDPENIAEFLEIASQTESDASFRARLRIANKQPAVRQPKPEIPINEKISKLFDMLPKLDNSFQKCKILNVLSRKYPETYKRLQELDRLYTLSLDKDIEEWLDNLVSYGVFESRSEAIECALVLFKQDRPKIYVCGLKLAKAVDEHSHKHGKKSTEAVEWEKKFSDKFGQAIKKINGDNSDGAISKTAS